MQQIISDRKSGKESEMYKYSIAFSPAHNNCNTKLQRKTMGYESCYCTGITVHCADKTISLVYVIPNMLEDFFLRPGAKILYTLERKKVV